jgi:hypothetical protein
MAVAGLCVDSLTSKDGAGAELQGLAVGKLDSGFELAAAVRMYWWDRLIRYTVCGKCFRAQPLADRADSVIILGDENIELG